MIIISHLITLCSELEKHIPDLHVLISTHIPPNRAERIKKTKNLQLLFTGGIGSDHIDLKAAAEAGLTVAEITGSNVVSPVEDELMRILILVRNFLPSGYHQTINGDWNVVALAHRGYDLKGSGDCWSWPYREALASVSKTVQLQSPLPQLAQDGA